MKAKNTFYSKYGKRWFDLVLTVPGFVVISPALLMIALLVRLQLGSPVTIIDVRAFGLTWEDCEKSLMGLDYRAKVEISQVVA